MLEPNKHLMGEGAVRPGQFVYPLQGSSCCWKDVNQQFSKCVRTWVISDIDGGHPTIKEDMSVKVV